VGNKAAALDGSAGVPANSNASRWRGFLALTAVTCITLLGITAGWVVWFDVYWLFRAEPPWFIATQGASKVLDRQTRRAKTLQALTREYRVAFIGSSTTYHGLDPDDLDGSIAGHAFNIGISAVIAEELGTVAALVASRPGVERVLIGLDYYMFSRNDVPVRLDTSLAHPSGRWRALFGSVVSSDALRASRVASVTGAVSPGRWKRNGFRVTPPLSAEETRDHDAVRRRTIAGYRPETLTHLDLALTRLKGRRVDVYITPVSDAQRRVLSDAGLLDDFAHWRRDISMRATAQGVRFVDFADLGMQHPFDAQQGSTAYWLDNLHFTPLLGIIILEQLELPIRHHAKAAVQTP
jgi:hypothetical protein